MGNNSQNVCEHYTTPAFVVAPFGGFIIKKHLCSVMFLEKKKEQQIQKHIETVKKYF